MLRVGSCSCVPSRTLCFSALGPVKHFTVAGTLDEPIVSWKPNSLDVRKADYYEFKMGSDEQIALKPEVALKRSIQEDISISVTAVVKVGDGSRLRSVSSDAIYIQGNGEYGITDRKLLSRSIHCFYHYLLRIASE